MSLPNYLAKIKSAGIYRFVWDKSEVPAQTAETLRLVVGYSEKGPFNTPVYIDNSSDFIAIYGNINKKLERKGIFFHRLALQALSAGPILALNVKPFSIEKVNCIGFDASEMYGIENKISLEVSKLYDTNRFWHLDADQLPNKVNSKKYITIAATDTKDTSCSIFIRPYVPSSYDITIRQWYANYAGTDEMPSYLEPIQDEKLNKYFAEVYVFRGEFTEEIVKEGGPFGSYRTVVNEDGTVAGQEWMGYFNIQDGKVVINEEYTDLYGEPEDALAKLAQDSSSNFIASYQGCLIPYFKDGMGNYVSLDVLFNSDNSVHKMLMKLDESMLETINPGLDGSLKNAIEGLLHTSIDYKLDYKYVENTSVIEADTTKYNEVETLPAKASSKSKKFIKIKDQTETYHYYDLTETVGIEEYLSPIYLEGYEYTTISRSDKGIVLQNKILKQLDDKGIRTALTNRVDVEYHYIVDTFQSYITQACKSKLAQIAKEKDNAFAILNFPSMSDFVEDGRFKSDIGKFDMARIADIKNGFSLVSEINGASWCAYYTGVVFSDGTLKQNVPSAAVVSNNFMAKYGARQPYYIVAGPTHGRISYDGLVGPDYNYGRSDLDVLEPLGVNAIIYVPRKGTYINSNQTAKQTPVTALSKVHVRELVIYLQDEIESMLQNYQWELNTQTLRDTIKAKADTILENVKGNGGIYAYTNVCESSNNTNEVIDNEMIILDTAIEPARGAGKMVQRLTIHRTGGITSSAMA